jgi:hypothetical protein
MQLSSVSGRYIVDFDFVAQFALARKAIAKTPKICCCAPFRRTGSA